MTYALTPRLVAIQGFELTPVALAVQGLIAILVDQFNNPPAQGGFGKNRKPAAAPDMTHYVDRLNREFQRQSKQHKEDQDILEFIMALVSSEVLDG
jgi:hypothetical protein